jgi:hypothetical protein
MAHNKHWLKVSESVSKYSFCTFRIKNFRVRSHLKKQKKKTLSQKKVYGLKKIRTLLIFSLLINNIWLLKIELKPISVLSFGI